MKAQRLILIVLLFVLPLAAAGCGIAGISTEGGQLTVDVNLSEQAVNNLIASVVRAGDNTGDFLLTEVSSVDLIEPNTIRVFGSADGVEGSYDMTMEAVDGALKIEVVAVNLPGVSMDDPRIQEANDEMAEAFLDQAQSGDPGSVADVAVVNNELKFTFQAPINP